MLGPPASPGWPPHGGWGWRYDWARPHPETLRDEDFLPAARDGEGGSGGRRDREPPAHDPRGHGAPARGRPLHVAAARPSRAAQDREHRARGDEPGGSAGGADARRAARGAVAGVGPLGPVRAGAPAPARPSPARLLRRTHPRGGDHRHRAARDPELPPAPPQPLPDPDQVPRRGPPALRRHALARVHHEGRLFVRPRRGGRTAELPGDARRVRTDLHPHRPRLPDRGGRFGEHRGQPVGRVPRARRLRRGRHRVQRRGHLRGQHRADPRPRPAPARRRPRGAARGLDPRAGTRSRTSRASSTSPPSGA